MKNTKILVRIGMGYDNVDIKAAGKLGISVSNVPGIILNLETNITIQ